MSKPINVEAQRIAKIIDDTQGKHTNRLSFILDRLQVLALLSHDLFVEIKKRSEEDLSKLMNFITALEQNFGAEAGRLLYDQAIYEERF